MFTGNTIKLENAEISQKLRHENLKIYDLK